MKVRRAQDDLTKPSADALACAGIYAHYVENTIATFELSPPTPEEMAARIAACLDRHDWLVAEHDHEVIGFAYASAFRERPAYDRSIETTIYLAPGAEGQGVGRMLYSELLQRMTERGFHTATAVIALPNEASEALHRAFGFEPVGTFREIGHKFDAWRDVRWYQRFLAHSD